MRLGPGSEFGFENVLCFFDLLPPAPQTDPAQVRHTFGFGYPALSQQENTLQFFRLVGRLSPLLPPHNRGVCCWNRGGKNIYNKFIELWKAHPPTFISFG